MKLDRLLAITMLLLNRKRVSAAVLAERFEVSMRTIYRDVETIQYAGIPVVSYAGSAGGYEIMDRYRLDRQFLSFEELSAIVIALRGVQTTLDDRGIEPLLDKVGAMLGKSEKEQALHGAERLVIDLNPWGQRQEDKEKLARLRAAIRDRQIIRFAYTNNDGERTARSCELMRLVLKGYAWYVYGYCLLRRDFRVFRLSRIRELAVTGPSFEMREYAGDAAELPWAWPDDETEGVELTLQVQPRALAKAEDLLRGEEIGLLPDGSAMIRARHPDVPWLYRTLLGFGTDVKVLAPAEVADGMRALASAIAKMYEEETR